MSDLLQLNVYDVRFYSGVFQISLRDIADRLWNCKIDEYCVFNVSFAVDFFQGLFKYLSPFGNMHLPRI